MGKYAEIPSNDDVEADHELKQRIVKSPQKTLKRLFIALATSFIAGSLIYVSLGIHHLSAQTAADYGHCGESHTVEEAIAHGCIFDPASWVWTRPECYDGNLADDFMKRANFSYHTEPELRRDTKVSLKEVMLGNHTLLFTQPVYHFLHCTVSYLSVTSAHEHVRILRSEFDVAYDEEVAQGSSQPWSY